MAKHLYLDWTAYRARLYVALWLGLFALVVQGFFPSTSFAKQAPKTAFLGVEFINDNEMYEPTTDAERGRVKAIEKIFKTKLEASGQYIFVPVPEEMKTRIKAGQSIGDCGGCEIDYGNELGVERIAWITVQKVSNLILNMNVYMADVATKQMTFVRSVDIRGNTDESWAIAIKWLIRNYMIPSAS